MVLLSGKHDSHPALLRDISYRRDAIRRYGLLYMHELLPADRNASIRDSYSWLFTRDPYERWVSSSTQIGQSFQASEQIPA